MALFGDPEDSIDSEDSVVDDHRNDFGGRLSFRPEIPLGSCGLQIREFLSSTAELDQAGKLFEVTQEDNLVQRDPSLLVYQADELHVSVPSAWKAERWR
jgi:hypothetical protein